MKMKRTGFSDRPGNGTHDSSLARFGVAESEPKFNEPEAKEGTRTGKIRVERGKLHVRVLIAQSEMAA
jgi:hypothetical protein